uniref:Tumor suppressor 2, mitochondrial calcium regulator n=1 Tax=Vombatus ursinus TaxID=29139 RepID=A0A4X2LMP2_VOMUR
GAGPAVGGCCEARAARDAPRALTWAPAVPRAGGCGPSRRRLRPRAREAAPSSPTRPVPSTPWPGLGASAPRRPSCSPVAGKGVGGGGLRASLQRADGPRRVGGSMYYDEDGDLAHEFYEETIVTKNGRKRAKLRRVQKNLIPQGIVRLDHPRLHVDFPVIICEM